ncbi:MAG: HesA/MoeB/ThiF family protein [Myxococcota bacterium]
MTTPLASIRVLLVGAGGLGSPAARLLSRSGIGALTLVDDDVVDGSNLHRQTLYGPADVDRPKGTAAADRLRAEARDAGHAIEIHVVDGRLLPGNALEHMGRHDLVVEGADNFATKFLTADAGRLARVPVVQAGAVRWNGWALAQLPREGPCLRCVFEDVPQDRVETCAEAGVVGPVVGVMGALEAALALRLIGGDRSAAGELWSYAALDGRLRRRRVRRRAECPLCTGRIEDLRAERYAAPSCAA